MALQLSGLLQPWCCQNPKTVQCFLGSHSHIPCLWLTLKVAVNCNLLPPTKTGGQDNHCCWGTWAWDPCCGLSFTWHCSHYRVEAGGLVQGAPAGGQHKLCRGGGRMTRRQDLAPGHRPSCDSLLMCAQCSSLPAGSPPSLNQGLSSWVTCWVPLSWQVTKHGRPQHSSCICDAGFPPGRVSPIIWMLSPDMSVQLRGSQATCCISLSTGESWPGKKCHLSPEASRAGCAFLICTNTITLN